ncbi:MAG TPA: amino acid ABC transporter substrate-binding protein [Acidimicrobiales bacterium]|nr:amino acid ABC transporter substrate-binding protein [Acidimicrobiales bacterium]
MRVLAATTVAAASLIAMAAASTAGASSGGLAKGAPVNIGISLSLSGDFSADGQAFQRGYELWAKEQNAHGGLLGHKINLIIKSDASSPTQVVTNYQDLISQDHVQLVFGPFSSLLTVPAAQTAERFGYAMVEGAGGAPSVFQAHLNNVFDVSLPVANDLMPFAKWISSLPKGQRPTTAYYVTSNDPFTEPQLPVAQKIMSKAGIKSLGFTVFPAEVTDYTSIADKVAAAKAQVVVLGSVDVPTVSAFMQAFEQAHYNPKAFIATGGPDQGAAFLTAVGAKNANGMMVPNAWYGGSANPLSKAMVAAYIKQYGGTPADINSDVAEAYSVGEVITQAVRATHGFNNAKIIAYLHSGKVMSSVQGPVKFNKLGENVDPTAFTFQWQGTKFVQVNPVGDPNSVKVLYPKPAWKS